MIQKKTHDHSALLKFDASNNSKLHQKFQSPFLQKMPLVVNLRGKVFGTTYIFVIKLLQRYFIGKKNAVCVVLCRKPMKLGKEHVDFMFLITIPELCR